jgi:hypothetical protein
MMHAIVLLTGMSTFGISHDDPDSHQTTVELRSPEKHIKEGMNEIQVMRLLGARPEGFISLSCGMERKRVYLRMYKNYKVWVIYEDGKVIKLSK